MHTTENSFTLEYPLERFSNFIRDKAINENVIIESQLVQVQNVYITPNESVMIEGVFVTRSDS